MEMFTQGTGMVMADFGLLVLAAVSSITSFAAYRSKAIHGSLVADHVRAIKSVAYAVLVIFIGYTLIFYTDAPISGPGLIVGYLLAFSDTLAALGRIGETLQRERLAAECEACLMEKGLPHH